MKANTETFELSLEPLETDNDVENRNLLEETVEKDSKWIQQNGKKINK